MLKAKIRKHPTTNLERPTANDSGIQYYPSPGYRSNVTVSHSGLLSCHWPMRVRQ